MSIFFTAFLYARTPQKKKAFQLFGYITIGSLISINSPDIKTNKLYFDEIEMKLSYKVKTKINFKDV